MRVSTLATTGPTNVKELMVLLNAIFVTKTINEWLELLEASELPCAPINTIDRIVNDPQIKARNMTFEIEHPAAGHQKWPVCRLRYRRPVRASFRRRCSVSIAQRSSRKCLAGIKNLKFFKEVK